ncbi:MAG TPA: DNA-binding response regulator, partial [Bacteroidota bacterium]|nr:DNA-binding response regulator [Bacteroidota bacterium]
CRKLKEDWRTSHIPVILLTAKAALEDKLDGLDIGADDYIVKPFEAGELKSRVRNLLQQRNRLQEHFRMQGFDGFETGQITSVDRKFLDRAMSIIKAHLSDTQFGVDAFAREMAVSKSLLFKKLHGLLGESPSHLTRRVRLDHAAKLIEGGAGNMAEIAFEVGFSNPSHFAEVFKKQYGVVPSHYKRPADSSSRQ